MGSTRNILLKAGLDDARILTFSSVRKSVLAVRSLLMARD